MFNELEPSREQMVIKSLSLSFTDGASVVKRQTNPVVSWCLNMGSDKF